MRLIERVCVSVRAIERGLRERKRESVCVSEREISYTYSREA